MFIYNYFSMEKQKYLLGGSYTPPEWIDPEIITRTHLGKEKNLEKTLAIVRSNVTDILWNASPGMKSSYQAELTRISEEVRNMDGREGAQEGMQGIKYSFRVQGIGEWENRQYSVICKKKYSTPSAHLLERTYKVPVSIGFAVFLGQHLGQVEFARYKVYTPGQKKWKVDVYGWANDWLILAHTKNTKALVDEIQAWWSEHLLGDRKKQFSLKKLQKNSLR